MDRGAKPVCAAAVSSSRIAAGDCTPPPRPRGPPALTALAPAPAYALPAGYASPPSLRTARPLCATARPGGRAPPPAAERWEVWVSWWPPRVASHGAPCLPCLLTYFTPRPWGQEEGWETQPHTGSCPHPPLDQTPDVSQSSLLTAHQWSILSLLSPALPRLLLPAPISLAGLSPVLSHLDSLSSLVPSLQSLQFQSTSR